MGHVPALVADTKRRQAKAGRGDASQIAFVRLTYIASVPDQARIRVGLVPKISKIRFLKFLENCVVAGGEGGVNAGRGRMVCLERPRLARRINFSGQPTGIETIGQATCFSSPGVTFLRRCLSFYASSVL